mgnify:CR=1 FL=1
MSVREKFKAVFQEWDRETFRDIHHDDFMFIRETELLTLDEHVENIDRLVREKDFFKTFRPQLIHENEFISEARWEDNEQIITRIFLMKQGKAWRQIVSRTPFEDVA